MAAKPLTFVHAADLHLDTPFAGVERAGEPHIAARLRDATLAALDNLVDLCLTEAVDFLVIAGDLYDTEARGVRGAARFRRGMARLAAAGIHAYVCHGNHDPLRSSDPAALGALENVTLFGPEVSHHVLTRDGEPVGVVHGVSYGQRSVRRDLAADFSRATGDGLDALPQIGVLHATVGAAGAAEETPAYAPTTLETLLGAKLDYWALGHVHTRTEVRLASPAIVYPGNPQSLSRREQGARGAYLVTLDDERCARLDFRPLDIVRFAELAVDIGGFAELHPLVDHLVRGAETLFRDGAGRSLILSIRLTGRGPLHGALANPGRQGELLATLRDEAPRGDPFCHINRLAVETAPTLDLEEIARRRDLAAALLSEWRALDGETQARAPFIAGACSPLMETTHAGRYLDQGDAQEEEREWRDALTLALSLLEGESA